MDNDKLINDFINYLKRRSKAKSTLIAYQNDIKQLSQTNPNKSLVTFQEADVKQGLNFLQNTYSLSAKTISRKLNSIRTFYKFLEDKKLIKQNPTAKISHPKFRVKKQRILLKTEYLALKEESRSNKRIYMIIEFLLQTGIRISELSRIKIKDLNLNAPKPFVVIDAFDSNPKREVPLNQKITIEINEYLETYPFAKKTNAPLFATKTGKSIEVRNIRGSIDRVISRAKIKNACVNDLRNTFIVTQLTNGMSIAKLAQIVGHKNIATTGRYLDLLNKKYRATGDDRLFDL